MIRLVYITLALLFLAPAHSGADLVPAEEFVVPEGLEVTVWATSPMFYNPTNFDVDERGRIWVAEAVNYRKFKNKGFDVEFPAGDRIVWLEDTNGDGTADKSQVFVQDKDLVAPLGIAVFGNRVLVASAPHMVQYTDVDNDGVFNPDKDKKELWLTGFGGQDHDHSLHSICSGPDGWWYFNAGNAGPHIVTDKAGWTLRAGSSYNGGAPSMGSNKPGLVSDDGRMWVGGVALRIRPDGTGMTPIGHNFRNSYEECLTSWGDVFQNDNDDPPACRTTWLMEYGNLGFASADGTRTWKADQNPWQDVATAEWRQDDPGTIPAGDIYGNGSPTGICIYENGALGEKHRNLLLSCEAAKRVIYGYYPKAVGAGFELERFDFMKPKDGSGKNAWFRPSDVGVGHDGAIYVTDWYDPGVGGHRMQDMGASGTIYRIAPKGFKPVNPKVDLSTLEGAVTALKSPANNVRFLGFEKLAAAGEDALPLIRDMATKDPTDEFRARAIWLWAHTESGKVTLRTWLKDGVHPYQRLLSFRALRRAGEDVLGLANIAASDKDIGVRREVLLALRDVDFAKKLPLLKKLAAAHDGNDRWYVEAIGTAAEGHEAELFDALNQEEWSEGLADIAWRLHPPAAISTFKSRALGATLSEEQRKKAIVALAFSSDKSAAEALAFVANEGPTDLQEYANWWGHHRMSNDWKTWDVASLFPRPVPVAQTGKKKPGKKGKVVKVRGKKVFESKVVRQQTIVDIGADISGSSQIFLVVNDAGDGINSDWGTWVEPTLIDSKGKETKLTTLLWSEAGSSWNAPQINKAAGGGKMNVAGKPVTDGIGCHANGVIRYDIAGRDFVRLVAKGGIQTEKAKGGSVKFEIYAVKASQSGTLDAAQIAKMKGDVKRGKALFAGRGTCFTCHTYGDIGRDFGPDMGGIGEKFDKAVILDNIISPSAAIAFGYETWVIKTKSGGVISGFLVADADPLVIKDIGGTQHTLAKSDIASREQQKLSIMPPAAALGLSPQDLADLAAFLSAKK